MLVNIDLFHITDSYLNFCDGRKIGWKIILNMWIQFILHNDVVTEIFSTDWKKQQIRQVHR